MHCPQPIDRTVPIEELIAARRDGRIDRRGFLRAAAALAAAMGPAAWLRAATGRELPPRFDAIIAALQAHLLPSAAGAPGANDINALGYLHGVFADPLVEEREKSFLASGADWLEDSAADAHQRSFTALSAGERETLLRAVERSRAGRDFIALVLYYLLEALLTDPVYGGNPDAVGWRWLEHAPGFPRPEPGSRAFELPRA
jgi:gluconate 2-dehydrogenase gamma chain